MPHQHPAYPEVRGLTRGLAVLRALNAMPGGMGGVMELARATGLHRTTVKRLLETLRAEGLVHHRDDGSRYALGFEVRRLSEGYVGADWIDLIAAPAMQAHLPALHWPSDLATPDAGFMIVRESTHRNSLLSQHRATIGIRIPMLVSSLGRAWLAWCSEEAREAALALLLQTSAERLAVDALLATVRQQGYAINRGEWKAQSAVTAIALPILVCSYPDGGLAGVAPAALPAPAIGAINMVLYQADVDDAEIMHKHLPALRALAAEISSKLATSKLP